MSQPNAMLKYPTCSWPTVCRRFSLPLALCGFKFYILRFYGSLCLLPLAFCSCGSPNTPLDADTRQRIDSAATEQIRLATFELDTHCTRIRYSEMLKLVDSIKQVRIKEIEEQLKAVPK